ncbi:RNA polymerase sigma factor SigM [Aquisphaera giovannonii]|uniref:RNA polymerase sigma factor SigM n=1 Tax=Aquisphaera giovannonii TaxID=406548 RepID=A0A5B9WD54_9BACT|nr:sigma-70 family RNA polymerase sigma factor [Aquisphaera giovannonii]QEH38502.1 RNA polymerase sigma factor SigM [Aquisphaera giovannonii]
MADGDARTTVLVNLLDRMRAGDRAAVDELVRAFQRRLAHLARKMLRRYPGVERWVEDDDVLQASLVRLLRALESVRPASTSAFFGLAAEQMRRELLDLARHFFGPQGIGANHASRAGPDEVRCGADVPDPRDGLDGDLDRWTRFHEEVAKLPAEDRAVVDLLYYHGWKQAEAAELLGVHAKTVRRRWEAVLINLHGILKD